MEQHPQYLVLKCVICLSFLLLVAVSLHQISVNVLLDPETAEACAYFSIMLLSTICILVSINIGFLACEWYRTMQVDPSDPTPV